MRKGDIVVLKAQKDLSLEQLVQLHEYLSFRNLTLDYAYKAKFMIDIITVSQITNTIIDIDCHDIKSGLCIRLREWELKKERCIYSMLKSMLNE